jgi:imidazoleglycerol-phosphate dehydratase
MSTLKRETRETQIEADVRIGTGQADVQAGTGQGDARTEERFLIHMVETLARYSGLDIRLRAEGDLRHHLIEDVAITLGIALADEVPAKAARYGSALVPMDEALAQAAVDLGGRPYYVGKTPSALYTHFLHSFSTNLGATVHVQVIRGSDRHHMVEAAVKAVGLALREALVEGETVFSTKGSVKLERI